jgi:hypothetical protein
MDSQLVSFMVPGGNYGYTGAAIDTLTSPENTLAVGLLDESGSTQSFSKDMEQCVKEIVKSLRMSSVADTLIYRHCHFGTHFREVHGYTPLNLINESIYEGCYQPGGQTTFFDSADRVLVDTLDYASKQSQAKYLTNGLIYFVSDGMDYGSILTANSVRDRLISVVGSEQLESLITIMIGVNPDEGIQKKLKALQEKIGFTQYVELKDANQKTLARIANFVSQSVIAQSQALGSGAASRPLQF